MKKNVILKMIDPFIIQRVHLKRVKHKKTNMESPLVKVEKIGEGTYGIVYKAYSPMAPTVNFALKRNIIDQGTDFTGSLKELDILNRLRGHPYIVNLLSVSFGDPFDCIDKKSTSSLYQSLSPIQSREYKDDKIHFLFEHASRDGHNFINDVNVPLSHLKLGMIQMLLAVEYIHARGIIHRDIKPSNILIFWEQCTESRPIFKLCDFGLSKPYTIQGRQSPKMVTSWYRAPEICLEWPQYSTKIDLWSLGCVFYEMLNKRALLYRLKDDDVQLINTILAVLPTQLPQKTLDKMFQYRRIPLSASAFPARRKSWKDRLNLSAGRIKEFNSSPGTYSQFLDLLNHLLVFDPDYRFSATDALNHPFCSGYRSLIDNVRESYPPVRLDTSILVVYDCPERRWACQNAFILFNLRDTLPWYKHRIIFQALDLYDRYIAWAVDDVGSSGKVASTRFKDVTTDQGYFHTRYEAELRFMVCLYISIKYFTTMFIPMSYKELAADFYKTPEAMREAEAFEIIMIRDVLEFAIYRDTLYEVADLYGHYLDDFQVRELLMIYGMLTSYSGMNVRELYELYLLAKQ